MQVSAGPKIWLIIRMNQRSVFTIKRKMAQNNLSKDLLSFTTWRKDSFEAPEERQVQWI